MIIINLIKISQQLNSGINFLSIRMEAYLLTLMLDIKCSVIIILGLMGLYQILSRNFLFISAIISLQIHNTFHFLKMLTWQIELGFKGIQLLRIMFMELVVYLFIFSLEIFLAGPLVDNAGY